MVNQEEFWREIKRKQQREKCRGPRVVPAFTIQALQNNTVVEKPPRCSPYDERPPKAPSTFRRYYERGVFPLNLEIASSVLRLNWKCKMEELDYNFYLPLFFDGLIETKSPYTFLAEQGIYDMLEAATGTDKVLKVLPQLILPIKRAVDTRIPDVLCRSLRVLQQLVRSGNCIGEALVPYYRQILPVFNLLKDRNVNLGEDIDYAQQRGENVSDLIQETLEILEHCGGEDAFPNIKYIVATYESCMKN
ncbi:parkin coregulated gene protein homolog [Trichogramma pretiosum]|uniref:parkin coregulated gene protein homolog n=1 Tax=Trichogramma pretiosum TaxID=7493 RepID=UPI0006C963EF|nr:parkin coregulated gene protein homolog [Trichogramma pretiosum]